jgi:hypothetical protein
MVLASMRTISGAILQGDIHTTVGPSACQNEGANSRDLHRGSRSRMKANRTLFILWAENDLHQKQLSIV